MGTIKRTNSPRGGGRRGRGLSRQYTFIVIGIALLAILFLSGYDNDTTTYTYMASLPQSVFDDGGSSDIKTSKSVTSSSPTTTAATTTKDSSTATVMAMATGYGLDDYQRFVGSLRNTGYKGYIILAVSPDVPSHIENYLLSQSVAVKKVQYVNCSHPLATQDTRTEQQQNDHDKEILTCVHPYPNLKHRWARFPLLRDYLVECTTCTGPVLITDMRDTIFQRDPFGADAPPVNSLQVFEEHYTIRTTHWLVDWPVFDCKGVRFDKPMLCSGTTIGTRETMIEYLRVMHAEMVDWMNDPKCCCFPINGDDQSMHNYLFYSGKLDHVAVAVPNRMGIVNTVGAQGALIWDAHLQAKREMLKKMGKDEGTANQYPFDIDTEHGNEPGNWLGLQYGMTDKDGYFVNYNGERSFVAHQIDRLGFPIYEWIEGGLLRGGGNDKKLTEESGQ
jgi:hypothetical protein